MRTNDGRYCISKTNNSKNAGLREKESTWEIFSFLLNYSGKYLSAGWFYIFGSVKLYCLIWNRTLKNSSQIYRKIMILREYMQRLANPIFKDGNMKILKKKKTKTQFSLKSGITLKGVPITIKFQWKYIYMWRLNFPLTLKLP